ncbi:MAG TPA: hypothetical protein V6D10_19810 [Trichocoleus sp.]
MNANAFQQTPDCLICQFYTCNLHLRCTIRPYGVESGRCADFVPASHPQHPEPHKEKACDKK